jgi:hypothetical protein
VCVCEGGGTPPRACVCMGVNKFISRNKNINHNSVLATIQVSSDYIY